VHSGARGPLAGQHPKEGHDREEAQQNGHDEGDPAHGGHRVPQDVVDFGRWRQAFH